MKTQSSADKLKGLSLGLSTRRRAGAEPAEWPEDLRVQEFQS